MTYSLEFDARALKEWHKLGDTVRQQLKKKLTAVLSNPRVEANRLHTSRLAVIRTLPSKSIARSRITSSTALISLPA